MTHDLVRKRRWKDRVMVSPRLEHVMLRSLRPGTYAFVAFGGSKREDVKRRGFWREGAKG